MGMVTDVNWNCPGCGSRERAQLYGTVGDGSDLEMDAVPMGSEVKWNPVCTKCGRYRLTTRVIAASLQSLGEPADGH